MFPITLSQTGGSAGNSTTQCSFTYTVTDPETSAQLGTGVNPTSSPHTWNRPSLGTLVAADSGMAFYNASDQLVIVFVNETPDVEACS